MKPTMSHAVPISLTSSVRGRLMLWYLATVTVIVCLFGASLYVAQAFFNADAAENRIETHLFQDGQQIALTYQQALLHNQDLATLHLTLSPQEMVLLLHPDGKVLDNHSALTGSLVQQLQVHARQNIGLMDLAVPPNRAQSLENAYRILIMPVFNQNIRVATLLVGLPRSHPIPLPIIWFFHGLLALCAASLGGYWLAQRSARCK